MEKSKISLIINTFPPKAGYLEKCLENLQKQSLSNFEIIIVNDGDDKNTKDIIRKYLRIFPLKYHSRENDNCLSRSRNIGVKISGTENLVFIDSDVILNSYALEFYFKILNNSENLSIWGKFGELKEIKHNETDINDLRLPFINLKLKNYIENYSPNQVFIFRPFFFTFGGNFGITKKLFLKEKGFDEKYRGWGHEDIEFGFRLYKEGCRFLFSGEVWGIHLQHERNEVFHINNYESLNQEKLNDILEEEYKEFLSLPKENILFEFQKLMKEIGNKDLFRSHIDKYIHDKNNYGV